MIDGYEAESNEIRKSALSLSWSTRGGATYEDILNMSFTEREMVAALATERMEVTSKSNIPYF